MKAIRSLLALLVVANMVGVLGFGWMSLYAIWISPVSVAMNYTQLDRAGVIDEKRLAETYPYLATNPRCLVPRWIVEPIMKPAQSLGKWGLALCVVNVIGCFWLSLLAERARPTHGGMNEVGSAEVHT